LAYYVSNNTAVSPVLRTGPMYYPNDWHELYWLSAMHQYSYPNDNKCCIWTHNYTMALTNKMAKTMYNV